MSFPGLSCRDWVLPRLAGELGESGGECGMEEDVVCLLLGQCSPPTCLSPPVGISPFFPALALMSSLSSKFKSG